jgi:2-amino-4-hydroxy-6-hydroxymethyldihydropteridine diphosphokinase
VRPLRRPVAIAAGSNLGDRHAALAFAVDRLSPIMSGLRVSAPIETKPEGAGLGDQPLYLNAAIAGETDIPSRGLLDMLLRIEHEFGRERPYPGAARTLDLDLILAGAEIIEEPGLVVPHPRFRARLFVLAPLAEIAPDFRDPVTGSTVEELLRLALRGRK